MLKFIYLSLFIILFLNHNAYTYVIKGNIYDNNSEGIQNVKVRNLNNNSIAYSKKNGQYKLTKIKFGDTITFSYNSFVTQKYIFSSRKDTIINIILLPKNNSAIREISSTQPLMGGGSTSSSIDPLYTYKRRRNNISNQNYNSGTSKIDPNKLTAGEINDFAKWDLWNDLTDEEFKLYSDTWELYPKYRYSVIIQNNSKFPIYGANVQLLNNDTIIWESITDNTGKAELWLNPYNDKTNYSNIKIKVSKDNYIKTIDKPKEIKQGLNFINLDINCNKGNSVDIAFLIDATASMQDEIDYLKADLKDIIQSIKDTIPHLNINIGICTYRDYGDEYVVKHSDLSDNLNQSLEFLNESKAAGGGDYPEAVEVGLYQVINNFNWSEQSVAKVVFLILDAPPHNEKNIIDSLQQIIKIASAKGIRIIPITCSGIEKDAEFLMRTFAILTNGTYTFLTDHSGIGDMHIEPSTDKYEVEILNDLIKRLIIQYSYLPKCDIDDMDSKGELIEKDIISQDNNQIQKIKIYPNPTKGEINIELPNDTKIFYIADINGKLILQMNSNKQKNIKLALPNLPNGVYFVVCQYENKIIGKSAFIISG